jgi:hypothetical protein
MKFYSATACSIVIAIHQATAVSDCDFGAVNGALGPVVGFLNNCQTDSGYNYVPLREEMERPSEIELKNLCSRPSCQKAASAYLSVPLPDCAYDLQGQRIPAKDFFVTLCPQYENITAMPTLAPTADPTNAPNKTGNTDERDVPSNAAAVDVSRFVLAGLFAMLL